jgi:hypothetical protein
MAGFIRIMMDQLVQALAGSQRGHEQDQPDQQCGNERLAELEKMFLPVLQTVCNLANDVPAARLIFGVRLYKRGIPLGYKRRDRSLCRVTAGQSNMPPRFPIKKARSDSLRAFESKPYWLRLDVSRGDRGAQRASHLRKCTDRIHSVRATRRTWRNAAIGIQLDVRRQVGVHGDAGAGG